MTFLNPCGYGAFIKKKKKSVIYDSVDEELQLQTSVRSDGGGGRGWFWPPQAPLDMIMSKNLHADFRDIFIFVVNSRWKKIEEEKNALDAMKQSLEKEGGKINRVLLVWLFSYSLKR